MRRFGVDASAFVRWFAVAEFAADVRKERQLEGIAKAKEARVYKGRKPAVNVEVVKALKVSARRWVELRGSSGYPSLFRALVCY